MEGNPGAEPPQRAAVGRLTLIVCNEHGEFTLSASARGGCEGLARDHLVKSLPHPYFVAAWALG